MNDKGIKDLAFVINPRKFSFGVYSARIDAARDC
jgi:hypothetical protein